MAQGQRRQLGQLVGWHLAHIHAFLPWGKPVPLDQFDPFAVKVEPVKSAEQRALENKLGWDLLKRAWGSKTASGGR